MPARLRRIAPPEVEPISLEAAKLHLRVDHAVEDALIAGLIGAAREWAETFTGLVLADTQYELRLDALADTILPLPLPQALSVDAITYLDPGGAEQTLDPALYIFEPDPEAPSVTLAADQSWPAAASVAGAVRIRFTAGFGEGALPGPIRAAILLMVGHLYERRADTTEGLNVASIPMGAEYLLRPYRIRLGMA